MNPEKLAGITVFEKVQQSSLGWPATAAGTERIASNAGRLQTALRNRFKTATLEKMVFFLKNRTYRPSVDEIVAEVRRIQKARNVDNHHKRAAVKAARGLIQVAEYEARRALAGPADEELPPPGKKICP